jgi:hypothetical protein
MTKRYTGTDLSKAEQALWAAKRERDAHAQDCTRWGYESDNECPDCGDHRYKVHALRMRWSRIREALGL